MAFTDTFSKARIVTKGTQHVTVRNEVMRYSKERSSNENMRVLIQDDTQLENIRMMQNMTTTEFKTEKGSPEKQQTIDGARVSFLERTIDEGKES